MPVTVVLGSVATWWIDTFMTELSNVIRNWAAARTNRTNPLPAATCPAWSAAATGRPGTALAPLSGRVATTPPSHAAVIT